MAGAESFPKMDWEQRDVPKTFKLFKQKLDIHFKIKKINDPEIQVAHVMRGTGDHGIEV
jgi:hypothetical protein